MNLLTAEFIQRKSILKSQPVPGDGVQAPGYVTLRQWATDQWAIHFYNAQDGGFHNGRYFNNLADAEVDFTDRVTEYAPLRALA
ncbi:hypothetical protein QUA54_31525 [Microcoleus sp. MOSTC5]|uniref:hypothetical protein n=1 Tax=Microcoleus sp. MOSTC5 TaxID=3055378 RepID=UPI002FD08BA0